MPEPQRNASRLPQGECDGLLRRHVVTDAGGLLRRVPVLTGTRAMHIDGTALVLNTHDRDYCRSPGDHGFNSGDLAGRCRTTGTFANVAGRMLAALVRKRAAAVTLRSRGVA